MPRLLAPALAALVACGGGSSPPVPRATVTITVTYDGAAADVVESLVLGPIEHRIAGLPEVAHLHGVARAGLATVEVELAPGRDALAATHAIRAAIDPAALPVDADPPVVLAHAVAQDRAVAWTRADDPDVVERLQRVPGVHAVDACGVASPELRVWIDPGRLAALGLSIDVLVATLRGTNLAIPSGGPPTPLGDLPLRDGVRLGDVALVEDTLTRDCLARTSAGGEAILLELAVSRDTDPAALRAALGDGELFTGPALRGTLAVAAGAPEDLARVAAALVEESAVEPLAIAVREDALTLVAPLPAGTDAAARAAALDRAAAAIPGTGPLDLAGPALPVAEVTLVGDDLPALLADARAATERLRALPGVVAVTCDPCETRPAAQPAIDRDRAAALGISPTAIRDALALARPRGLHVGTWTDEHGPSALRLGLLPDRDAAIPAAPLAGRDGAVPLDHLVTITTADLPRAIRHEEGRRAVRLRVRAATGTAAALQARVRDVVPGARSP